MIPIEQTNVATAPEASQAAQSSATSTLPAPSAPVAPTASAKTPTKKVVKAPAKKVAGPVKTPTTATVKPVAQPVAKKAPLAASKPVTKTAAKAVVKAAPTVASQASVKAQPKAVAAPKVEKLLKTKKPKLVRDSFTIPKLEYLILEELKQRSGRLGNAIKKSELIRAGIKALASMSDASLVAALKAVPAIKTGRPAKD